MKKKIYGLEQMDAAFLKYNYEEEVFEKVVLPENIRVVHKIIAANNELWLTTSNGMYCYQAGGMGVSRYITKLERITGKSVFAQFGNTVGGRYYFCRRY